MCNHTPLVATFTDAAALALFDPAACNRFRVDVTGDGQNVALGFVQASVSAGGSPASTCLFDGFPGNPMCHGGVCIGTNPVVCAAHDDCHVAFCTRHAGCRVRRTRARRFCARHPGRGRG